MAKTRTNSIHKSSASEKFALLSVFNKTGIVPFAKTLTQLGYKTITTGGTAKALRDAHIPIIPIQEVTGNPESFDGRMKTISFEIESGILFDRKNATHIKEAKLLKIKPIDIVVNNLYPFEETINKPKATLTDAIENIDVGGPTMIRAAAKNFKNVLVVVDPKDYDVIANALEKNMVTDDLRQELAAKAFAHLSFYDSQISTYLKREQFPQEITLAGRKLLDLRYGENPHQAGAVYTSPRTFSQFNNLTQHAGRGLSLTNVTDINAGIESVKGFKEAAAVVIKHNSPCGIALGKDSTQALSRALDADPESAFGGVVVLNKPMDLSAAKIIAQFKEEGRGNMDIIAAPSVKNNALSLLQKTRKTTGVYSFGKLDTHIPTDYNLKWIQGGFVIQTPDEEIEKGFKEWKVVTKKKPTKKQLEQMKIAWKFITRIRSNAIIVVDKSLPMTRGIGTGQTSRVRSVTIALEQAKTNAKEGILASDSFFPFDDSVKAAAKAGITAIVQQGGSINDQASIDAADRAKIIMVMTGRRAFWH